MSGILHQIAPKHAATPRSFEEFLVNEFRVRGQGQFTWQGRNAMREIARALEDASRRRDITLAFRKGTQIGASTLTVAFVLHLVANMRRSAAYFLPTDKFAHAFDQREIRPAIRKIERLAKQVRDQGPQTARAIGLRQFGEHFLWCLGLESTANAVSVPLDATLFDEVDLIPVENMDWADDRLGASDMKLNFAFSQAMNPGLGIDRRFQDGSQRRWMLRCPACGRDEQILEELFPANVRDDGGHHRLVCIACGRTLDPEQGRWVAAFPKRETDDLNISFSLSALAVPGARTLDDIMRRYRRALGQRSRMAKFRCSELAIPDAGAMQPLTAAALDRASAHYRPTCTTLGLAGVRTAGLDMGDICHFAAIEWLNDGTGRVVWAEEIVVDCVASRAADLFRQLGVWAACVDAKPERGAARRIAASMPGRVWLQDFRDGGRVESEPVEFDGQRYLHVSPDREDSLEKLCDLFLDTPPKLLLPHAGDAPEPIWTKLRAHLGNLQKEEIMHRGTQDIRFKRGVENHFGMALNSAVIAAELHGVAAGQPREKFRYEMVDGGRYGSREARHAW